MKREATVLYTKKALINNRNFTVEQLLGNRDRQDIFYRLSAENYLSPHYYSSKEFWQFQPKFIA